MGSRIDQGRAGKGVAYIEKEWERVIRSLGAISTEHSASELRVIGTNDYRVDSFFATLQCIPNLTLLCSS